MKKVILTAFAAIGICTSAFSQKFFETVNFVGAFPANGTSYTAIIEGGQTETFASGNWTEGWTNWDSKNTSYGTPTSTLQGEVTSDKSLSGVVNLIGTVHVKNGAVLSIAAGTVFRCGTGATLIISKGSKINAIGSKTNPIVFTSDKAEGTRAPGDWAGILIIGNSQVNTASGKRQYEALPSDPLAEYGGGRGAELNVNDNSGEMRFVRIEFAGYNYLPDQELNGLTLGAVGAATKINFVQVSYARDDSFEWFGGTSKHKYLVAYAGVDDDFDMDEGYAGQCQFLLGVRNPSVFETAAGGTSNGFEHDNNTGLGSASQVVPGNNNPTPATSPILSNVSLFGPWAIATQASKPGNKFGRGLEMRSAVQTSIYNSIVTGYATLAQLVHPTPTITPSVSTKLTAGDCIYKNVHLMQNTGNGSFTYATANNAPSGYTTANFVTYMSSNGNTSTAITTSAQFQNIISNFDAPGSGITYAPVAASTTAALTPDFSGIIAPFSGTAAELGSQPSFGIDKGSLNFGTKEVGGTFSPITFNVTAANVTGTGFTIASNNAAFTVQPSTLPNSGGSVTVSFSSLTAVNATTSISVTPNDNRLFATTIVGSAKLVSPLAPRLNVNIAAISFTANETTLSGTYTSATRSVTVSGRLLTNNVTVTAPSGYLISNSETGTFAATPIVLTATNGVVETAVFVQLSSTVASSSNAGDLAFTSGTLSAVNVALSANTNAVFTTGTSANVDYFTLQTISSTSANFNVRGDRLPLSILITTNNSDIELATASNGPWASTATLTTTGRIISTSSNVWARYIGVITGTGAGVQVGTISVTGVGQTIPFSLRLNSPSSTNQSNFILASSSSNVLTALGFAPNARLSGTPFLYNVANSLIGRVSALDANFITLSGNSLVTTNTVSPVTFTGTIDTDINSPVVTGTGTSFVGLPVGLPIHLPSGVLIGTIASVPNATEIVLSANALVSTTTSAFRTSAIYYRRSQATLSVSPSSPLAFTVSSYDVNGNPNPVSQFITITGSNHDFPLNVGINPALSASGYMFEITNTPGTFTTTLPINANGSVNQQLEIRYIPTNVAALSLPGVNVNAAHSTELLILGNNRALALANSSNDPRGTIAFNLRGSAQAAIATDVTTLAKFNALTGIASAPKKFTITGSRIINTVMLSAPTNFQLSRTTDFTGASNMLNFTSTSPGVTQDIYVIYKNNTVANESGSISIVTNGISPITVSVEGETSGTPFINISTPNSSNTFSFTGNSMFTVSGNNLTEAILVSVTSSGFEISNSPSGSFGTSVSLAPSPSDFGNVAPTTIYVKAGVATVTSNGMIEVSTKNVTTEMITIINVNTVTTSIINVNEDKNASVVLYPNPTEGDATLAIETLTPETISVLVYNITGTVLKSFTGKVDGFESYQISGLDKGLYFVSVKTGNTVKTVKLIVR
ncbi:MAG: T9SS C-terminal target domain-containing protein [Bacteroidetes bacterium]|nr:MAG: T9SS C-terminal target domain-containing protein [Bacteroidota bacterium]